MIGLGLGYAGINIGICWDCDWDMLGFGLGCTRIGIALYWDWD
jgi:hypothetical protein